jgi:hypothetical protein
MEQITYKQACELLGVKYVTIKDAVLYGKLTRCVYPEKQALLLKAQVELFKGKRISVQSLSLEDRQKWEEYKSVAMDRDSLRSTWPPSVNISDKEYSDLAIAKVASREGAREATALILARYTYQLNVLAKKFIEDIGIDVPKELKTFVDSFIVDMNTKVSGELEAIRP